VVCVATLQIAATYVAGRRSRGSLHILYATQHDSSGVLTLLETTTITCCRCCSCYSWDAGADSRSHCQPGVPSNRIDTTSIILYYATAMQLAIWLKFITVTTSRLLLSSQRSTFWIRNWFHIAAHAILWLDFSQNPDVLFQPVYAHSFDFCLIQVILSSLCTVAPHFKGFYILLLFAMQGLAFTMIHIGRVRPCELTGLGR